MVAILVLNLVDSEVEEDTLATDQDRLTKDSIAPLKLVAPLMSPPFLSPPSAYDLIQEREDSPQMV